MGSVKRYQSRPSPSTPKPTLDCFESEIPELVSEPGIVRAVGEVELSRNIDQPKVNPAPTGVCSWTVDPRSERTAREWIVRQTSNLKSGTQPAHSVLS